MQILTPSDAAEYDSGDAGVAGKRDGLLEGDDGEREEVGEEVHAETYGGEIEGDGAEEDVGSRVVVVGDKCIWRRDGVEISMVAPAEEIRGPRVENVAVRVVLCDLRTWNASAMGFVRHVRVGWGGSPRALLTSRARRHLKISLAMDHGIGRVVVTLSAFLPRTMLVRNISRPAWKPIPSTMLSKLIPTTAYHFGVFAFETLIPPVRVGRAFFPWRLSPTDKVGMMESKRRNNIDGMMKNISRIPRVPTTSTLRGDCESTNVDHVI